MHIILVNLVSYTRLSSLYNWKRGQVVIPGFSFRDFGRREERTGQRDRSVGEALRRPGGLIRVNQSYDAITRILPSAPPA